MLKKTRAIIASVVFALVLLLFLDFTGALHPWLGWLAMLQLVPAILALNAVALIALALLAILFGRIYCSTVCPLGAVQDCISNVSGRRRGQKARFSFSRPMSWLRYSMLAIYTVAILAGASAILALFDPYAGFGRIASDLLAPIYRIGNNALAGLAEAIGSYAFYSTEVWLKSWLTFGIALLTLASVGLLAWRHGRTYCNTVCPVGTFLGLFSRFSLFRLALDSQKCTKCGLCEKGCKASCIDSGNQAIDYSRCVSCFNCIDSCKPGAIQYRLAPFKMPFNADSPKPANAAENASGSAGMPRRSALAIAGGMAFAQAVKAPLLHVDGGLAEIQDKKMPHRRLPVIPPGALSIRNMKNHCTACQLCISNCPNNVLRPSSRLHALMRPEMSFERGYCRPECVECSLVCPSSAIQKMTKGEKTTISIGSVAWIKENCVVSRDQVQCNSCERRCPTDAITLVGDPDGGPLKIPAIDNEKCIGCGACEYYCPARPFSAIFVEGHLRHHVI